MNILVTGGAGFIGSHVVDALVARGDRVMVLDDLSSGRRENLNQSASFTLGDVADASLVERLVQQADAVVHLAAIASVAVCEQRPDHAARVNVTGTETIFKAAAARAIPVVYASSAAVYGDNPALPLAESATPSPLGNYGRHKLANEATAAQYPHIPSVGLRFFNVYGPRQDPHSPYSGVISIFAARAKAGEPLTLFGDGEQTRDFIYIDDIVRLILASLTHASGALVLNGCTGKANSLKQLASAIAAATGTSPTLNHAAARPGDIRHSLGDPSLADKHLSFKSEIAIIDGLKRLVNHA